MTYVKVNHLRPQSQLSAMTTRALLDAARTAVLAEWAADQTAIRAAWRPAGVGDAYDEPNEFVAQVRDDPDRFPALHDGLEGLFARDPAKFAAWLWKLVRSFGLAALRYEQLLEAYEAWDTSKTVRFAAMARGALGLGGSPDAQWNLWRAQLTTRWTSAWTPPATIAGLGGVVMVPGRSGGEHWADSSALSACHARADAALPSIKWILNEQLTATQKLVVLCSGGSVRSPTAEATLVRLRLQDRVSSWPSAHRARLVFVEDGLSRHSGPNARAAARLALLHWTANLWVVTEPFHYIHLRTQLADQWDDFCMTGLIPSDRSALRTTFPVTFDVGTWIPIPPSTRGEAIRINGTALVPAVGNALDT